MSDNPKNKIRYGLKNVHWAPLTFGANGAPTFGTPVAIPGAVNLSLSNSGEDLEFYADDGVYYAMGNNSQRDGDLEIALIPENFRTGPMGETLDSNGVLIERSEAQRAHFALLFEFSADVNAVRHVLYNCTASQKATEGQTRGKDLEVKTETLSIKARALPNGIVKAKTGDTTDATVYNEWYDSVYEGPGMGTLTALTVASVAGTASGDSKITVSGYTLGSGEKWMYKTAASTAPTVSYGDTISEGWTQLTSGQDITPTSGHTKIAVVAVNSSNKAIAYGSATITTNT